MKDEIEIMIYALIIGFAFGMIIGLNVGHNTAMEDCRQQQLTELIASEWEEPIRYKSGDKYISTEYEREWERARQEVETWKKEESQKPLRKGLFSYLGNKDMSLYETQ